MQASDLSPATEFQVPRIRGWLVGCCVGWCWSKALCGEWIFYWLALLLQFGMLVSLDCCGRTWGGQRDKAGSFYVGLGSLRRRTFWNSLCWELILLHLVRPQIQSI